MNSTNFASKCVEFQKAKKMLKIKVRIITENNFSLLSSNLPKF